MTHTDRFYPPPPTSVSPEAQAFLATPPSGHPPYPAADDVDGWLEHQRRSDGNILGFLGGIDLPVEVTERSFGDARAYVIRGHEVDGTDGPVYLDIHGGALVSGGGDVCRVMGSVIALVNGLETWSVDYRMPPLHPFPTPLDDCVAVYRALLEQRPADQIFVGGVSAGGNLAAALLLRAKAEGLPLPRALVLVSPEVDLTESGDSFRTNDGIDSALGSLMPVNELYAGGHDLADPLLSPLFGDLTGFPPTFLQTGTRDLFLSNTVRMHRALLDAGVSAELHVWEALGHAGGGGMSPEDFARRQQVRDFVDAHRERGDG